MLGRLRIVVAVLLFSAGFAGVSASLARPAAAAVSYGVTATVGVGSGPQGVAVDPSRGKVYVANYGSDTVSVIDEATDTVTATISVGTAPGEVAIDPSIGKVWVVNSFDNTVSVIDEATDTVTATITVGDEPFGVAVDPFTGSVYVTDTEHNFLKGEIGSVAVINELTNTVTTKFDVVSNFLCVDAGGVGVDPATGRVWVSYADCGVFGSYSGSVWAIDGATNTALAQIGVGNIPVEVGVDPVTGKVWVAARNTDGSGTLSLIDESTNTTNRTYNFANMPPWGVGVNPSTGTVYVTIPNGNTVFVIDEASLTATTIGVGSGPLGVGVDPVTGTAYVANGAGVSVITPIPDNDLTVAPPANITTDATGPSGAAVTYPLPTVSDPNDATAPPAVCDQPSGATFPIGTTTVTCTATDPNDANSPVSTSFTVTVRDTDLALTGMPAGITVDASSPNGVAVAYAGPTAVDEDNPVTASVSCDHASGSTFPIGTTTVSCTATDPDDLNGPVSATFAVTVRDTDLALTGMPTNITVDATGPNGAAVAYAGPTAVDEDNPVTASVSCDHASGSTFPIGTTTVTCTPADPDDLNSPLSAAFTVTVHGAADQLTALGQVVPGVGTGTSLAAKVAAAQSYLAIGDRTDACAVLTGFIHQVQAQSGKTISAAQAAQLIASASQIQAVLGC